MDTTASIYAYMISGAIQMTDFSYLATIAAVDGKGLHHHH
jgi:hypothetical protein